MRFVLKKLPPAEADLLQAACWHDEQERDLGSRFIDTVELAVRSLAENALLYRIRFADVRRMPVPNFPKYGVFYYLEGDEVRIISIFHGSRHPRWLRQRRRQSG